MRTFLKLNIILLFSLLSISFIMLLSIKTGGVTREEIKSALAKSDVYPQAISELNKQMEKASADNTSDEASALIFPIIKKEITPEYLRGKTEKFIDDTGDWMTGKTQNPPAISFRDLKEKILSQNAQTIEVLTQLNKEYEAQKEQLKKEAAVNGEIVEGQEMPSLDFNKLIQSDFSIPVGKNLDFLKTLYSLSTSGLTYIGIFLIFLLAAIILLSKNNSSRFKWIGITFLSSALWNFFISLLLFISSKTLLAFLGQNKDIPAFVLSLSNTIVPQMINKYTVFSLVASVIFFLIFIVFLFASSRAKT